MEQKLPWEVGYENLDISNAIKLPMNYEHNVLGFGQEMPGIFRKELVDKNVFTTFDAIKLGLRTATSRKEKYKKGQLVIFYKKDTKEQLLCLITHDSYKVSDIDKELWSLYEGWDISYMDRNPKILDKYQFRYKYIKSIF